MTRWEYATLTPLGQCLADGEWKPTGSVYQPPAVRMVWVLETSAGFEVLGERVGSFQLLGANPRPVDVPRDVEMSALQALDVVGHLGWIASANGSGYFLRRECE